ncbi:MAG: hypothetical protein COA71_05735 [SAR86 cluster bacterium]|uniref:Uncharacterized protein n=1 Tax=SAR86 cluster bacterium TaxID=2030880 RepID=A0A2A5CE97_9GAMM|nr:MAG: hypothetical protein COA71_05735 [SAR86 cluster bacterium]
MKRCAGIPKKGARVLVFDPNKDHGGVQFTDRSKYARALAVANRSGRGFRLSFVGSGVDTFEWWCKCVLLVLDGSKTTYILCDEYSAQSPTSGLINPKAFPAHAALWLQSRKYGGVIRAASHRPQNISKDALENAANIYVGGMGSRARKSVNAETDIPVDDIKALVIGEFFHWKRGAKVKKISLFG